jgi:hypothetical protein
MASQGNTASTPVRTVPELHREFVYMTMEYGPDANPDLLKRLHNLVIGYYTVLRPYRNNQNIKEMWQSAQVVSENDAVALVDGKTVSTSIEVPNSVTGIDALGFFINANTVVETTLNRSNNASTSRHAEVILSGDASIRAGSTLTEVAHKLKMIEQPQTQGRDESNLPEIDPGE